MPSCRPDLIPDVLYAVMELEPRTILDVGAGAGKWGVLCREYLRYWKNRDVEVDGIEPHEAYRCPAHDCYRVMSTLDVRDVLGIVKNYDLVLMIDVIEHLPRDDGERLLGAVTGHYIVTTPNYWSGQGVAFGNEYERHVSRWTLGDFTNARLIKDRVGRTHIFGWR